MAEAYIVAAARTAGGRKRGPSRWMASRRSGRSSIGFAGGPSRRASRSGRGRNPGLCDADRRAVEQRRPQRGSGLRNCPKACQRRRVDRQCGSSQQALHFAAQAVMSGSMDCVIAAGVESMTRVPMGLPSSLPAKKQLRLLQEPEPR